MNFKLRGNPMPFMSLQDQVLLNRGVPFNEIQSLLHTTDADINFPTAFNDIAIEQAYNLLIATIKNNRSAVVVVDADCDGYCSAALIINYLYDKAPNWVLEKLEWFVHDAKQHGLSDCIDRILQKQYDLIIIPDASSNDYDYHKQLYDNQQNIIILDHHEAPHKSDYAITINNQLSDYPNKEFSGVGITWQFCRYIDGKDDTYFADDYLDLVALGNCADMMDMRSLETNHIIRKGLEKENLKNPFIVGMAEKNAFSLGERVTPMGAAFYIAPFVNAMVRSGNLDERILLFNSMLKFKANETLPSTKKGHKLGDMEKLLDQALRVATNVKNRQTREETAGMAFIEGLIESQNLMSHQVLLFLLEPGQVERNIAGLVGNKIMSKYQRPCCVLTKTIVNGEVCYQGSARGCGAVDVSNFKDICEQTGVVEYAQGHQGAFGLGIKESNIAAFIEKTDELLKDMPNEPVYYVDCLYDGDTVNPQDILDIAALENYWGRGIEESYIGIKGLKVTEDMLNLMKRGTLRFNLKTVQMINFNTKEDEYDSLIAAPDTYIDVYGKPDINTWNGVSAPQIKIKEFEIVKGKKVVLKSLF